MSGSSLGRSLPDQIREDLSWLLANPSLLDSELGIDTTQFCVPAEFDPSPVEKFLAGHCSHRVGYYFEALVQILLESAEAVSDVEHGIQICENGATLGEIDFLYRRNGELHHLEVALKFYLYSPDVELCGSHLLGPNARDTFERKRDRLFRKQIPLGKERFSDVRESRLLVKGAIFYPWLDPDSALSVTGLAPDHCRGIWIRDGQLADFLSELPSECRGAIFRKPFWLSSAMRTAGKLPLDLMREISRTREESQRPLYFNVGTMESDRWTETQRVFVVGDSWPFDP